MSLHPAGGHYRNQVVKLPELAVTDDLLEDLVFEDCHIIGPAVIIGLESEINDCTFDGDLDAILWPVDDDRRLIIGAIGLRHCKLLGCRLSRVGIAIRASQVEAARQGFGAGTANLTGRGPDTRG